MTTPPLPSHDLPDETPAPVPRLPAFARDEKEADERYQLYRHRDPFLDIKPALLNSADLLDYIAAVGMLSPYEIATETRSDWLKPASCAVACTGDVLRFTFDSKSEKAERTEQKLSADGQRLRLPPNSITFLQLGTTFRIPDYIAARFNLAIREIHRGILVGTGPLVDPGFVGRLFIPLHNLTSNEYSIKFGEPIVWVEFTKLSPNQTWRGSGQLERVADFAEFPVRKLKRKLPNQYLDHANEGKAIASSIPEEISRTQSVANSASAAVVRLRRWLQGLGFAGVVVGAFAVFLPMIGLVSDTNSRIDAIPGNQPSLIKRLEALELRETSAKEQATNQSAEIRRLRAALRRLKK